MIVEPFPKSKIVGQSVYVALGKEAATVTVVFEINTWETSDTKIVYFPIFAQDGMDPIKILAQSRFEFEVGEIKNEAAVPCAAPPGMMKTWNGYHIYWFAINIGEVLEAGELDWLDSDGALVRFTYTQSLLGGRFYYLPLIPHEYPASDRLWQYHMIVRAAHKPVAVVSKKTDYCRLADVVIVYLRSAVVTEIE